MRGARAERQASSMPTCRLIDEHARQAAMLLRCVFFQRIAPDKKDAFDDARQMRGLRSR